MNKNQNSEIKNKNKKSVKDILSTQITFADIKKGYSYVQSSVTNIHNKIRFINTFWLKLLAVITMTIDHTAVMFGLVYYKEYDAYLLSRDMSLDTYENMRIIGRIAFPIFCFLIVEGFFHTKNIIKYSTRLFIFALISQVPFSLVLYRSPFIKNGNLNVYFTLFLGLLAVAFLDYFYQKYKNEEVPGISTLIPGVIVAGVAAYVADLLHTDYGSLGVLIILLFYIFRKHPILLFIGLYTLIYNLSGTTEMYALWALIPILLHNGKKGPGLKYFFYLYYPLHLTVLFLLHQYII